MISETPEQLVISDTTCLALLTTIGELDRLRRSYTKVLITPEVLSEYGLPIPDWIEVRTAHDVQMQQLRLESLDLSEATALSLAWELRDVVLIPDDLRARKAGLKLGLRITGTLGVIVKAKQKGLVERVTPIIEKNLQTNFRVSETVAKEAI